MSVFFIGYYDVNNIEYYEGGKDCKGAIIIGGWKQDFLSSLDYWSCSDYIEFWRCNLEMVIKGGDLACLITNIRASETIIEDIMLWSIYRENNNVFIRNRLVCDAGIKRNFSLCDLLPFIKKRVAVNEWGQKYWEKQTDVAAIKEFLESGELS